ncbi:MAG TPA: enolase C-terminal domain-like protein, partial [Thermoplasmata archaeon]|nr:enolase C-terminal domain-like protein [Thermoplasmata archaeon]
MRIDFVEHMAVEIPRKEPFTIAKATSTVASNILVIVHSGSRTGHGAGAPTDVTHETPATANDALRMMVRALEGFPFERPGEVAEKMDRVMPGNPSVKAAFDIAVHDLAAQQAGVPLYRYLGATKDRMPTDMTIGIMDAAGAVARAQAFVRAGFRSLKIKVGRDPRTDLERLRAIRGAIGPGIELRVDGNQGYTWTNALSFARAAASLNVAFFEQPVAATDFEGMRVLTESSPIPIMADE